VKQSEEDGVAYTACGEVVTSSTLSNLEDHRIDRGTANILMRALELRNCCSTSPSYKACRVLDDSFFDAMKVGVDAKSDDARTGMVSEINIFDYKNIIFPVTQTSQKHHKSHCVIVSIEVKAKRILVFDEFDDYYGIVRTVQQFVVAQHRHKGELTSGRGFQTKNVANSYHLPILAWEFAFQAASSGSVESFYYNNFASSYYLTVGATIGALHEAFPDLPGTSNDYEKERAKNAKPPPKKRNEICGPRRSAPNLARSDSGSDSDDDLFGDKQIDSDDDLFGDNQGKK
jgi:hypothetical protein